MIPLPPDKRHIESFNDLALQWVPEANLACLTDDFWALSHDAAVAPEQEVPEARDGPRLEEELKKLSI